MDVSPEVNINETSEKLKELLKSKKLYKDFRRRFLLITFVYHFFKNIIFYKYLVAFDYPIVVLYALFSIECTLIFLSLHFIKYIL